MYYSPIPEIDVEQLAVLLAESNSVIQLLDVRERNEAAIATLPNFDLYPLSEFDLWSEKMLTELDPAAETVVICHHGMRSAQLCQWLSMRGFSQVKNVRGGIDAYSRMVDPAVRRY